MHAKTLCALALTVLSSSAPAVAAPPLVPKGTEFRVDTDASAGFKPRIAAFPDGGFVVVWTGAGARARFLDSAGRPAGGVIRLPGVVGFIDQVVVDRDGSFLLVWSGGPDIYVRRFNRNGTPKGKRIRANLPSTSLKRDSVATIGPDGRFAVAWKADVSNPGSDEVLYTNAVGRIFTANGTPLTAEILLLAGDEASPAGDDVVDAFPSSLALKPDGTLVALAQQSGYCFQSYLVQVPPGGTPSTPQSLGSIFCGNPFLGRDGLVASLAMGKDGSLVAAWSEWQLMAQRFAPGGTPRGKAFPVSSDLEDEFRQVDPAVAPAADGSFVILWEEENRDGDGGGVFGRVFSAAGTPLADDFQINATSAGWQYQSAIASAPQGPVVVVWSTYLGGIFARLLEPAPW